MANELPDGSNIKLIVTGKLSLKIYLYIIYYFNYNKSLINLSEHL